MLGVHNLQKKDNSLSTLVEIESIHVHKHWNIDVQNYDGDIAILKLVDEIQFNNFVRPICLAEEYSEVAEVSTGIVVGFGITENGRVSNIANKLEISITDYHRCILKSPDISTFATARTFCGGPADGRGVCSGDSGSGVYVKHNEIFYLRGLVSSSLVNNNFECNTYKQAIFTDVTQYHRWIKLDDTKKSRRKRFLFV